MNKKWTIAIVVVLIALLALLVAQADNNTNSTDNSGKTMSFNVSAGSSDLSKVIDTIKTLPYYEGYDVETVKWMESLGNKQVFFGNNSIVIMNSIDASKMPQEPGITDVYIYNHFTAEVIETHELCNKCPTVYYVQNVANTSQEIVSNGLA